MFLLWICQCACSFCLKVFGSTDLSQSHGWSQASLCTWNCNPALLSGGDLSSSTLSPIVLSPFPAAFLEESEFSYSEEDMNPRAIQPTESLRGLGFDFSLPTTPSTTSAETHWRRSTLLDFTVVSCVFSLTKVHWAVLPGCLGVSAVLWLALPHQMNAAQRSQWTVGWMYCWSKPTLESATWAALQ